MSYRNRRSEAPNSAASGSAGRAGGGRRNSLPGIFRVSRSLWRARPTGRRKRGFVAALVGILVIDLATGEIVKGDADASTRQLVGPGYRPTPVTGTPDSDPGQPLPSHGAGHLSSKSAPRTWPVVATANEATNTESHRPELSGSHCEGRPSFDCRKARSATEIAICGDPDLANLDCGLATVYGELKRALDADAFGRVKSAQNAWLQDRESCGTSHDCISAKYRERTSELSGQLRVPGGSPTPESSSPPAAEPSANVADKKSLEDQIYQKLVESFGLQVRARIRNDQLLVDARAGVYSTSEYATLASESTWTYLNLNLKVIPPLTAVYRARYGGGSLQDFCARIRPLLLGSFPPDIVSTLPMRLSLQQGLEGAAREGQRARAGIGRVGCDSVE